MRGVKKAVETRMQFTIIMKPHKTGKGYIIMEIMSTNVTDTTTYCGENAGYTTYYGGCFTISLHKISIEKCQKVWQTTPKT